jgi:hypothetical protein
MHLIVKPCEEKLPQVEETDVDIAAEEFGESVQIAAKSTTVTAHLRTSVAINSSESTSFVL